MQLRRILGSSSLVRLLSDLTSTEVQASRQDFAERLGLWLNVFDAITLHAAHQSISAAGSETFPGARPARTLAPVEEFRRARAALVKSITAGSAAPASSRQGGRNPLPQPEAPVEPDAGYAPHHQRHLDQQRHMAARVDALRAQVRQAIGTASPALAQLASFDAVMQQMLAPHTQKQLATVPVLLERRFEMLRQRHQQGLEAARQQDDPALWRQPGGWLDVFGQEQQAVLLAELEVRLEPVAGLIEAFSNEVEKYT